MGYSEGAAEAKKIAGSLEEQAKTDPDWQVNKQLYDRMNDAINHLIGKYLKAKDMVK